MPVTIPKIVSLGFPHGDECFTSLMSQSPSDVGTFLIPIGIIMRKLIPREANGPMHHGCQHREEGNREKHLYAQGLVSNTEYTESR